MKKKNAPTNPATHAKQKTSAELRDGTLLGRFFHSVVDGKIKWQGVIVGNPEPGWYKVQLFGWLDGSPNVQRLVPFEDMKDWLFYDDSEALQFSYDHGIAREGGEYRRRV